MKRSAGTVLAAFALLGAGCGSDDEEGEPIPRAQAQALLDQLALVEDRSDRGICGSANTQVDELEQKVEQLPENVDPDVRSALEDGLDRLRDLVSDECEENQEEPDTDTTETEPEVPTETQTEETDTEEDEEEPETETQPTETEPPPTETEPPPEEPAPLPGEGGGVTPPGQQRGGGGTG